jgi:hypothetical protein
MRVCLVAAAVCAALSVPVLAQPAAAAAGTNVEIPRPKTGVTTGQTGPRHPAPARANHAITVDAARRRSHRITGQN